MTVDVPSCPACGAPRAEAPECPRCGVIYAKARPRLADATTGLPSAPPGLPAADVHDVAVGTSSFADADERQERAIRFLAIPIALAAARLVVAAGPLRALARIACSMWLHEAGHALVGWWCGFSSFPGPWRTWVADDRGWGARLAVLSLVAGAAVAGFRRKHRMLVVVSAALLAAHVLGAYVVSPATGHMLVTFGGDAGALVLGSACMATIFARPDGPLGRGWLRWGFLVIGALTFADVATTWWDAHGDIAEIPYGENEGVGPSDASVLADSYGWSPWQLVNRHLGVAAVSLASLAVGAFLASRRARGATFRARD